MKIILFTINVADKYKSYRKIEDRKNIIQVCKLIFLLKINFIFYYVHKKELFVINKSTLQGFLLYLHICYYYTILFNTKYIFLLIVIQTGLLFSLAITILISCSSLFAYPIPSVLNNIF